MIQNTNVLISSALLHETMGFYAEFHRFPVFFTTIGKAFVNDVFAIQLGQIFGKPFVEWYQHFCLPLQVLRPNAGADMDIFAALPQEWKITQAHPEAAFVMPFPDLRQILNPLVYAELVKYIDAKLLPYVIDLFFCFVRGSGSWEIITTPNSKPYFEQAFQLLKKFTTMESHDPVLSIQLCTPTSYLFDHRVFFDEFERTPFAYELYHKQDLLCPAEMQENPRFTFYPHRKVGSTINVGIKKIRWETLAYQRPGQTILDQFTINHALQIERTAENPIDPSLFPNPNPPMVFVITPAALQEMAEFYRISKLRISPVLALLVRQKYVRFAIFGEFIPLPKMDEKLSAEFISQLNPIILPPLAHSSPLRSHIYSSNSFSSDKIIKDCELRGRALKNMLQANKKNTLGIYWGILGTHAEYRTRKAIFTLQSVLRNTFWNFGLNLTILYPDTTVFALQLPRGLPEQTYYVLPGTKEPHPSPLKVDHRAWGAAYNQAIPTVSKKQYPPTVWDRMLGWEDASKIIPSQLDPRPFFRAPLESDLEYSENIQDTIQFDRQPHANVIEQLQKPFQTQLREVLAEVIPQYFPELQEKLDQILQRITLEFSWRDVTIPYAFAAAYLPHLSTHYSPRRLRKLFKTQYQKSFGSEFDDYYDKAYAYCTHTINFTPFLPT